MIEKWNCSNWDEVVQYHPDSSKPHVLEKYMLLFSNTNKDPRVAIKQIPLDFEQFLSRCCLESVEEMNSFVTPRSYTLAIADAPYGFNAPNFVNDDIKGEWVMDLFAGTGITIVSALKRGRNVVAVECDPLQVKFIEQRVTALKELPDEFQEEGMKIN
ncbi:hypothetical protein GOP47_0012333 [Adiantum capillus-veneris]|uniref:DNA methylase N-4/N-6 domain-containing protein n=1 Tax=Adiantum capillus-veneris TaxID=13818 RepID=A0A9D4UQZ6_ADICA|nr:hypothetical protein GOP47_0012333 [Adiantum capillus-veneris]